MSQPVSLPILASDNTSRGYTFRPIESCSDEHFCVVIPWGDPSQGYLSYYPAGSRYGTGGPVVASFVEEIKQLKASRRKKLFSNLAAVISGVAVVCSLVLKKRTSPGPVAVLLGSLVAAQYYELQARKNVFSIYQKAIASSIHKRDGIDPANYRISWWSVFYGRH